MIRSAPRRLAARTAHRPTAPSPTTATVWPASTRAQTAAKLAGGHHVRERDERAHHLLGMPGARDRDQRRAGQRHADRLALAAVAIAREHAAVHARRRHVVPAVRARAIAVDVRRDDEIARGDAGHVGADVLDDADELVADRPRLERRVAAVEPEVRPADAGDDDADDRVGGLDDRRITAITGRDRTGPVEDRCTHGHHLHPRPVARQGSRRDKIRRRGPPSGLTTARPLALLVQCENESKASGTLAGRPRRLPGGPRRLTCPRKPPAVEVEEPLSTRREPTRACGPGRGPGCSLARCADATRRLGGVARERA
jgi:hypothetical protein